MHLSIAMRRGFVSFEIPIQAETRRPSIVYHEANTEIGVGARMGSCDLRHVISEEVKRDEVAVPRIYTSVLGSGVIEYRAALNKCDGACRLARHDNTHAIHTSGPLPFTGHPNRSGDVT